MNPLLRLSNKSSKKVMGILNITPDSFFIESRKQTEKEITERILQIVEEGGDIIDVGGYSSHPNSIFISEEEEKKRLQLGLKILCRTAPDAIISVDTFRSEIAKECVERFGATIVNDISGGGLDEKMIDTIAKLNVTYLIMHMQGTPQNMMKNTKYSHLLSDILSFFAKKIELLKQKNISKVWIDPGFGFSKTTTQNYVILNQLEKFTAFRLPIIVGISRKTMVREVLNSSIEEALNGTTALNMFALTQGANILRVHDVKAAVQTIRLYNQIKNSV